MRLFSTIIIFLISFTSGAQTLGGSTVFNFLKLSNTPQLSALGGINVSQPSNDVGMAFHNPSLLESSMHSQVNAVFNDFYAGISAYHLSGAYHYEKLKINFGAGLHYFNYGEIQGTDAAGNLMGALRPTDWVFQVFASKAYLTKWNLGAAIKFVNSNYGQYRSNGMAMDVGLSFKDTANLFYASLVARNMGFQIKPYEGTDAGDLPFDIQIGITKRLSNAPFSFSFTAHHLHQFDILYNDTSFNNEGGLDNSKTGFSFDKLFRHIILSSTVYLGDRVEVQLGYNHLRRKELNIGESGNGLNGFSIGAGVHLNRFSVRYARSHYQNNSGYNQFGLNLALKQFTK